MKPLADCKLYTFIDAAYLRGRPPEIIARQLCEGGSDLIQLRAKNSSANEVRAMAEKILPIVRAAKVGLVINDHLNIAQEIGAEFCHLGQEDFFDAGRTHVSDLPMADCQLQIGLSTHAPKQAQRALAAEPGYLAIGPVYATGTKPTARPVTLEYVRWAAANVPIPWFAIGGINLNTIDEVVAAGGTRVCVVSAILNSDDVAKTCAEFRKRLER